jgi:hypothetical protein
VGSVGALGLLLVAILSLGLAAVVWVPLLAGLAVVLLTVWAARRRRQKWQHRDPSEVKDPTHVEPRWPERGITDDRLPNP